MDIFRLHGVPMSLGLPFLAQMLSPLGYNKKCGITRMCPHLLKEMSHHTSTSNGKVKTRMGLRLLSTFSYKYLVWCCRQCLNLESKWLFIHLSPSLLLFASVDVFFFNVLASVNPVIKSVTHSCTLRFKNSVSIFT